jgi:hypothetical protein
MVWRYYRIHWQAFGRHEKTSIMEENFLATSSACPMQYFNFVFKQYEILLFKKIQVQNNVSIFSSSHLIYISAEKYFSQNPQIYKDISYYLHFVQCLRKDFPL